ncbi:hypothetical protein EUGRSUZ_A00495 [Eucalyptus grandis]|uniref:Uncharacterized protein n=2 Tax=Eucalyptus grandis TaxID=71139 RepID=A0ACC3KGA3_EUCGR|nr:hypothetical protein EUGRSUZ_A00495 [Eucalyptus grandis]
MKESSSNSLCKVAAGSTRHPVLMSANQGRHEPRARHQKRTREPPLPVPNVGQGHQPISQVLNYGQLLHQLLLPQLPQLQFFVLAINPPRRCDLDAGLDARLVLPQHPQIPNFQIHAPDVADELRPRADLRQKARVAAVDEARFRQPDELLDEVVYPLAAVGDEGENQVLPGVEGRGSESVHVLDELAEPEGLAAEADAGLEALEAAVEGQGLGEEGGGEDDLRGVPGDLEGLVDAVSLGEVGLEVEEEIPVSGCFARGRRVRRFGGGRGGSERR